MSDAPLTSMRAASDLLEHLLKGAGPDSLPVERLARAVSLKDGPQQLEACTTLLGDGVMGGLLLPHEPELVLARIEEALPRSKLHPATKIHGAQPPRS